MKEQDKELNEMEASKLTDTEFKTMAIRMLSEEFNSIKNGM